jgi:hypothetical protein
MSVGGTPPIPRVFISYAQYDPAHSARVLELAYALEGDGLAVELDQFHGQQLIDWPRWCAERLDPKNTDFVLMVCSAEYRRRIEGRVARDLGRGVFWEGGLIYGYLYEDKANARFVPLLLDDEPESALPRVVVNWNRFRLRRFGVASGDQGYEDLYRLLTGQPATLRPSRGTLKRFRRDRCRRHRGPPLPLDPLTWPLRPWIPALRRPRSCAGTRPPASPARRAWESRPRRARPVRRNR